MEESSAEHDGQKWGMFLENKIQQLRKERKELRRVNLQMQLR